MSTPPAPKKQRRSQNGQNESVVCEEDDADSPFNLYFVQVPDAQKKEAENLEIMFKAAKKCGLVPEWIDEQALDRLQSSDDFFVFPSFSGKIFRKIQARKLSSRLFGPPILSECLDEGKQLPDSRLPIFSSVFDGVKVSFTNIGSEKRAELLEKVAWMGGVVSQGLHGETTHLVCGSAIMSDKYKIATRNSIKLMRTDWIEDLWKTSSTAMGKFSALERDVIDSYSLPVFHGLHVVLSSIDGTDRMTLGQLIADNGGESQGIMRKVQCTHLVTENTTSQKYKKAMEWGSVKIVTTRWIRKCIDLGHIIDEAKYHPRLMSVEHIRSSTPKKDANMTSTGPDISSIHGAGGRLSFNNSCSVLTSTVSSQLPSNRVAFNASTSSSVVNSSVVQDSRRRSDQNLSPVVRNAAVPIVRYSTTTTQNTTVHDPIDELRVHMDGLDDLFENCLFLMFGVESKHIDKWRRFLDSTGATRVSKIDSATHVVVLDPSVQEKTTIRKFAMKEDIAIVTVEWVSECVRRRTIVATDEFRWTEGQLDDTFSQPTPTPSRDIPTRPNPMSNSSTTPKEKIFAALTFNVNDSLFKKDQLERDIRLNGGIIQEDPDRAQFVVFGATTAPMCDLLRFETVITDLYINTCVNSQVRLNLPEHPLFVPLPRPPTIVFDKRRIAVQCSASLLGDYIKSIVRSNGGELIENVDARSILVVMEDGKVPLHLRSRAVGLSWVISSLARNRVQPLEEHAWREGMPTLGNYQRDDDVWLSCIQNNEPTQEMEMEDLRVDLIEKEHRRSESRKTGSCPLENPYFPDLRQPFKMNLNLEAANNVINEMPSYVQQHQSQESFTTSMVGGILKQAVRNTGRRKEDVEPIVRPPSVVIAENRRTVSSTPVLQRKNNRFPEMSDSILDQNIEQVEALNREYAQRRHVLISSTEKDIDELRKCIESLGGVVDKDLNSDSSILITDRLKRSPNNLGMIAAGGWCLTNDYLYDSLNAGKWLPEEPYEWNLETVRRLGLEHDAHVKALAAVVKPWRVHVANMPITHSVSTELRRNGAFSDWRCAVHVNDSRMLQVCSIIEFGGAIVFQISEYIEVTSHRPTCAMASRTFPWNVQSAAMLKRDNIPLYNMEIVYEYLVHKNSLDLRTLYHPSYPQ